MTEHPNAHRLDGLAAGGHDPDAGAHLSRCAACARYVEGLRRALPPVSESEAEAFVAAVAAAAAGARAFGPDPPVRPARPGRGAVVARLRPFVLVAAPLLAAAAALLVVRWPGPPGAEVAAPAASNEGGLRFKGEVALAVIRERGGAQERLVHEASVRAGDRLRLEVSSAAAGPLLAGVLADDGAWLPLIDDAAAGAGTHFSERAARFDDEPTAGVVLAGRPDEVERAKAERHFEGVATLRLRYEQSP